MCMPPTTNSRKYLAEFIYGSIDGTVTTFAIISAVSGAGLTPAIILALGFANVFADGFSMASSNFLSQQTNEALGLSGDMKKGPWKTAIITFLSFIFVGTIPLLPFVYASAFITSINAFTISIIVTALVFLTIGFIRGEISHKHPIITAIETLIIGALASSIAYFAGMLFKGI